MHSQNIVLATTIASRALINGLPQVTRQHLHRQSCNTQYHQFDTEFMESIDSDATKAIATRGYDAVACTHKGIDIQFDNRKVKLKNLDHFASMYCGKKRAVSAGDTWSVATAPTDGSGLQQKSLMNGLNTSKGGKHVRDVVDRVVELVQSQAKRKKDATKETKTTKEIIQHHVMVVVVATIENPEFDAQTKEKLRTNVSAFPTRFKVHDGMSRKISNLGTHISAFAVAKAMESRSLSKGDSKNTTTIS